MIMREVPPVDWSLLILKILLTGITLVILVVICVLLISRFQKSLTIVRKREHILNLSNQGNFTSVFILSVASAERMFSFNFLLDDIPLPAMPQPETPEPVEVDSNTTSSEPSVQTAQIAQGTTAKQAEKKAETKTDKKSGVVDGAVKGGRAVAGKAGMAAALMGTLASLLPGSLGSNLRGQSESLRQVQTNAQAASQAPMDVKGRVETLKEQSGKMAGVKTEASAGSPSGAGKKTAAPAGSPTSARQPDVNSAPGYSIQPKVERVNSTATKNAAAPDVYRVQTQPVEPGESISLALRIEASKRSRPDGSYAYTLSSQQLPAEALNGEHAPVVREGVFHFSHIEAWRYWLLPVSSFLVIAALLSALIFIFRLIWL